MLQLQKGQNSNNRNFSNLIVLEHTKLLIVSVNTFRVSNNTSEKHFRKIHGKKQKSKIFSLLDGVRKTA